MLQSYRDMFTPNKEILQNQQSLFPVSSHPTFFQEWKGVAEDHLLKLQDTLEMPRQERETMNVVYDLFIEGLHMFLQKASNKCWRERSTQEKQKHIQSLLQAPQTEQRSQAWYEQAQKILTASEFGSLYGSERQYASLVLAKSGTLPQETSQSNYRHACRTAELNALDWGIRFEPAIKQFLESKWNVKVAESGRLIHPKDPSIAASPDGFFIEGPPEHIGRLVEIKCPLSRKIGEGVPFDYWCQMQIQMEVTDIDECMYIEVKIISRHAKEQGVVEKPANCIYQGTLWLLSKEETYQLVYAYTKEEKESYLNKGYVEVEEIPWYIDSFHTEVVSRERAWYNSTKQLRDDFWTNVEKAKKNQFKIPEPAQKRTKAQVCLISDSPPAEQN
jgi:putative phage-type endonuclease